MFPCLVGSLDALVLSATEVRRINISFGRTPEGLTAEETDIINLIISNKNARERSF